MFVEDWMSVNLATIAPTESVKSAWDLLALRGVRRLPVVAGAEVVGILTKSDIIGVLGPRPDASALADGSQMRVDDVMTRWPTTASPRDTIEQAALLMLARKISGLPVVDGDRLVGIITESDIFRAFVEVMGLNEAGARTLIRISSEADLLEEVKRRVSGFAVRSLVTYRDPRSGWLQAVVRLRGRASPDGPGETQARPGEKPD